MPKKELKDTGAKLAHIARSEGFKNYLIGIGATTGLILGLLAQFKGEPVAEKTWKTLREQVNKQSEAINQLHIRMETFQAVQEAHTSFVLERKLDELQKKYDDLVAEQGSREEPDNLGPTSSLAPKCGPGHVLDSGGRCRAVHAAVAAKVEQTEKKAVSVQKELVQEKKRRLEAESTKQDLMLELLGMSKKEQKPLKALPESLEDASGLK